MLPLRKAIELFFLVCCSLIGAVPARAGTAPSCSDPGTGWCRSQRFAGDVPEGELGFRFGEPLDADGDGRADVAAGARFKLRSTTLQDGTATVWSGRSGVPIRTWDGDFPDGLFGHWVLPVPDLQDDARADVIIAAPTARVDGEVRGVLAARSPATGEEIWRRAGSESENFGWDLALAGDQDGDGRMDVFVGAPESAGQGGRAALLSGRDGSVLRSYSPSRSTLSFGWVVARTGDLDADGKDDLVVGAPLDGNGPDGPVGGAYVFSAGSGRVLHHWMGPGPRSGFGEMVAAIGDLDGDGRGDVVVGAPRTPDRSRSASGEVWIHSGATGRVLSHWTGAQPGELFGRMIVSAGDLDGDGFEDLAIGAPWHRRGDDARVGRVELRSGRSGAVLSELFGDGADSWFGWHVRRAPDPEDRARPALLISSLRQPVDGRSGVGVLDLYVQRRAGSEPPPPAR